ncbi:hypothetical protein [Spirosoma areae]
MEKEISWPELMQLLDDENLSVAECQKKSKGYLGWSKLYPDFEKQLEFVANLTFFKNSISTNEFPGEENYWSSEAPIAAQFYPYNGCPVYINLHCLYLVYVEFGGHAPEKRCRLLQKKLIVL